MFHYKRSIYNRMSKSQEAHIKGVKLCHLFSTLEMFVKWNNSGVYDFHLLPYAMKKQISEDDEAAFLSSVADYKGIFYVIHVSGSSVCRQYVNAFVLES